MLAPVGLEPRGFRAVALADSYLDLDGFKARTVMPSEDVDDLESRFEGWIGQRLIVGTSRINGRMRKRYAAPFQSPVPEIVLGWLVAIVTVEAYQKRGWDPSDAQSKQIVDEAGRAFEELKEAADGDEGLFDLPLRQDTTADGIARGGPLGYSEQDPYTWTRRQAEAYRGR